MMMSNDFYLLCKWANLLTHMLFEIKTINCVIM
jgi:hypothetical protein